MLALGPIVGAKAVIVSRFAPIRHAIGSVTAAIVRKTPAIATVRRRIVPIVGPIARFMDRRGRIMAGTGPVADHIGSVRCRFGLIM